MRHAVTFGTIEILTGRAILALECVQIEVLGQVATNAHMAIPKWWFRALAFFGFWVVDCSWWTTQTFVGFCFEVATWWALYAIFSIEERSISRALLTFFGKHIVDLVLRAAQALKRIKIKVFGVETFNTLNPRPKSALKALTFMGLRVDDLSSWTILTVFICFIVIGILWARNTLSSIEDWSIGWAWNTSFRRNIINFIGWAIETSFNLLIKIFRKIALHAVYSCPECTLDALTDSCWG